MDRMFDEESGYPYYFNSETGEYTWEMPETTDIGGSRRWLEQEHMSLLADHHHGGDGSGDMPAGNRKPVGPARLVGEWEELWDEESQSCYYFNSESGEYQWDKPEGLTKLRPAGRCSYDSSVIAET